MYKVEPRRRYTRRVSCRLLRGLNYFMVFFFMKIALFLCIYFFPDYISPLCYSDVSIVCHIEQKGNCAPSLSPCMGHEKGLTASTLSQMISPHYKKTFFCSLVYTFLSYNFSDILKLFILLFTHDRFNDLNCLPYFFICVIKSNRCKANAVWRTEIWNDPICF